MDASRTGCTTPSADNVEAAIGYFKGGKYVAPNGKIYGRNSIVAKTARAVLDAQPAMARVKEVVAYSTHSMEAHYPESALSNWFIDLLMKHIRSSGCITNTVNEHSMFDHATTSLIFS